MDEEAADLARIRVKYLRHAVSWVGDLVTRSELEAPTAAEQVRCYFESVMDSLPQEERRILSDEIQTLCARLVRFETGDVADSGKNVADR